MNLGLLTILMLLSFTRPAITL